MANFYRHPIIGCNMAMRKYRISKPLICGLFALLLSACGDQPTDNASAESAGASGKKLRVVTTFTIIADLARNVVGDAADVVSVTRAGAEIHNYQPTPKDIASTSGADIILWNGMGLERWFEKFLQQLDGVNSAVITTGIEPMSIGTGPYQGKPNPHAWMSPSDAEIYVQNIATALSEVDPHNAALYKKNADVYREKIRAVAIPVREQLESLPENDRWLVTSEGAFSYLARDFGLKELYLWPINADQQGTPSQVRNIIDKVRQHKIKSVFSESTISSKPAEQIARETGAHYGGVLYVDSLSTSDGPVPTYLDLLRETTSTIVTGLQAEVTSQ